MIKRKINKPKILGLLMVTVILGAVIVVPGASACKIVKPEGYTKTKNAAIAVPMINLYIWCIAQCSACQECDPCKWCNAMGIILTETLE